MLSLKRLLGLDRPRFAARAYADAAGFATPRLRLRPVAASDVQRVAQLAGDWSVASMTARIPFPYAEHDARAWIDAIGDGEVVYAIEHGGALIGMIGYVPAENRRSAELGYWVGRPYWGQGFATESAHAVIAQCFERERFRFLTCGHMRDNTRSARVIEKLGFRPTGDTRRTWCEARRGEVDVVCYVMERPRRRWGPKAGTGA